MPLVFAIQNLSKYKVCKATKIQYICKWFCNRGKGFRVNATTDYSIDTKKIDDTYLIFTANNYRTDVEKADGKRPLAVRIEWECKNNKLTPFSEQIQKLSTKS